MVFNDEIHEIICVKSTNDEPSYTIELRAYLKEITTADWENQIQPRAVDTFESNLKLFKYSKPRFTLGERLRLNGNACVVKFIRFENYHYMYDVMSESYWGGVNSGWKVEESYLTR